jgi:hypothetical protein
LLRDRLEVVLGARSERRIAWEIYRTIVALGKRLRVIGFDDVTDPGEYNIQRSPEAPESPMLRPLYYALDFEEGLRGIPDYRQHFVHSFNVFLLGYYLLRSLDWQPLTEDCTLLAGRSLDELLKAWFLAAVYHVVAQPVTRADTLMNNMLGKVLVPLTSIDYDSKDHKQDDLDIQRGRTYRPQDIKLITQNGLSRLSLYEGYADAIHQLASRILTRTDGACDNAETQIRLRRLWDWLCNDRDHGIASAAMVLNAMLQIAQVDSLYEDGSLVSAVHAIAMHDNLWRSYKGQGVRFSVNPLGSLLVYCDMVQQWGRLPLLNVENAYEVKLWDVVVSQKGEVACTLRYEVAPGREKPGDALAREWATFFEKRIIPYEKTWRKPPIGSWLVYFQDNSGEALSSDPSGLCKWIPDRS